MWKKILIFGRRIIVSAFLLYGYNMIAAPLNLPVPINLITVLLLSILGLPALFALIVILLVAY